MASAETALLRDDETLNVGIVLYPKVEELDFAGPYETFTAASFQGAILRGRKTLPFQVFTVAEKPGVLVAGHGLRIQPDYSFADAPRIDLLVVPGGNASAQLENTAMVEWLARVTAQTRLNTSVCTGAFMLGKVGLLDGRSVTTHWASLDRLAEFVPSATVRRDVRWVDEGDVVTAAGVSAGIDMSLHVVERLLGRDVAEATARYMEYRWNKN